MNRHSPAPGLVASPTMLTPDPDTYRDVIGLRVIRNYRSEPISDAHRNQILEAGRWAGSSKNRQNWMFVSIESEDQRHALASAGSFTKPIRNASWVIALVEGPDGYGDAFDIGRAAQNIMLAAAALGVGTCPVTLHQQDRAAEVLGLPGDHRCRYAIALGYPDESKEQESRAERSMGGRKPLEDVVLHERF